MEENIFKSKNTPTHWSFSGRASINLILIFGFIHWFCVLILGVDQTKIFTLVLRPFSYISWVFALVFLALILRIIVFDILLESRDPEKK